MTGQAVAAWRATLVRPTSPEGDAGAQAALCTGMVPLAESQLRAHLEARTRFFDAQVVAALERGTDQVVVLGAGYDDRALRFRSPGVRFFEVDHPLTQADKRRRLHRMGGEPGGPVLVPADFRTDDVAGALDRAGHRADRPTLVLAEGLLIYLEPDAGVALLHGVHARCAPGSALAASLAVHPDGLDSASVADRANRARARGRTEPWRTILPPSTHLDLVARSGWSVVGVTDDADLDARAVPGRSLLVEGRP
jgi:methyltransferase (TIGR00027 family)